jgi:hypothetical protein
VIAFISEEAHRLKIGGRTSMRIAPSDIKGIAMTEDLQGKTLASERRSGSNWKVTQSQGRQCKGVTTKQPPTLRSKRYQPICKSGREFKG